MQFTKLLNIAVQSSSISLIMKIFCVFFIGFITIPILGYCGSVEDTFSEPCFNSFFSRMSLQCAHLTFQVGAFDARIGKSQQINIEGLIGDYFTVSHSNKQNFVLGGGFFVNGMHTDPLDLIFGINAFYLAPTSVQGGIIQENLFNNLGYTYRESNVPIYADAKALIHTSSIVNNITLDVGLGPNIIRTNDFNEWSLDGGITLPDRAFSGNTNVKLSATAGLGISFDSVFGPLPLEIGYRFFYLGQGSLSKINSQLLNTLSTGTNYANAIFISTTI